MTIQRTTASQQFDTLDDIAYRFFGNQSNAYLPKIVELNPQFTPLAILPMRSTVILPFTTTVANVQQRLKLWD